jgi:hypothetical protein
MGSKGSKPGTEEEKEMEDARQAPEREGSVG